MKKYKLKRNFEIDNILFVKGCILSVTQLGNFYTSKENHSINAGLVENKSCYIQIT